jgi:hypothetical protein
MSYLVLHKSKKKENVIHHAMDSHFYVHRAQKIDQFTVLWWAEVFEQIRIATWLVRVDIEVSKISEFPNTNHISSKFLKNL